MSIYDTPNSAVPKFLSTEDREAFYKAMEKAPTQEIAPNPILTRQLCKRCMKYSGLAFRTPDETWMAVTDDRYQHLCLPCFVDMADERMIDWEPGLLIYGESMAHLRERQERVAKGEYKDEGLKEWSEKNTTILQKQVFTNTNVEATPGPPEVCNHPSTDKGPDGIYCVVCLEVIHPYKSTDKP